MPRSDGVRHAKATGGLRRRLWITIFIRMAIVGVVFALGPGGGLTASAGRSWGGLLPRIEAAALTSDVQSAGRPTRIRIPEIDVAAGIVRLGLNPDETVQVPQNPDKVGWYGLGPVPGGRGSAVLLGHRDSKHGRAVFFRLRELKPGDRIDVVSDEAVSRFAVTRVVSYANEDFPTEKVYASRGSRPTLSLVTCGGTYDEAAGGYQSNVIVYTKYLWATSA